MDDGKSVAGAAAAGVLVGAGLALGGWFVAEGFARARMAERYVTVRGLVERQVRADVAV